MKLCFIILVGFFLVNGGRSSEGCTEERCLICRDVTCKCDLYGCGDDEKMSLKKLILHFLQKAHKRTDDEEEPEDDTVEPLVRLLRDILKRASCLNINEEIAIRDIVLTRLRTLQAKCPCLDQPHETIAKKFLSLLLDKCLVCDCGIVPCECVWTKKTCDPPTGMYWFRTTDEKLRKERPKRECCTTDRCTDKGNFDNGYKCQRFFGDDGDTCCEFSICTDCDNCQVVVLKGKEDILLLCDGCKVINSPYVRFTRGGCPVKAVTVGKKRFFKIRTKYLQLNDFRPQQINKECDRSDFECPSLSSFQRKNSNRRERKCS